MKRPMHFVSPWVLTALAGWIVVMGFVANQAKYAFVNVGDGPCGEPCVFVPPPIDWVPVLLVASLAATIVIAVGACVVVLLRRGGRALTAGSTHRP